MKTVIRHAPLVAGVIVTLVVFAFLDRIPDNPAVFKDFFKDRSLEQGSSVHSVDQLISNPRLAILHFGAPSSFWIPEAGNHLFLARTLAPTGFSHLQRVADSSPPAFL